MEVPYIKGQTHNASDVLIPSLDLDKYPVYKGVLRILDENENERNSVLKHGINTFGFLIPNNTLFRISLLGQLIKEYSTCDKANLIADLMLVNGSYLSIFRKNYKGEIDQI